MTRMNETKEDADKVHQVLFNSYRKHYANLSYKLLISGVVLVKETMYVKLAATVLVVAEVMIGLARISHTIYFHNSKSTCLGSKARE